MNMIQKPLHDYSTLRMRARRCFIIAILVILHLTALTVPAADSLAEPWDARLTNILGPVDFAREGLMYSLKRIYPQPTNAFSRFTNEKVSPTVQDEHQEWLSRIFKRSLYGALTNLQPSSYYLNEGRAEPSLLLYQIEYERHHIVLIESYEAFILTIKPPDFDATQAIDRTLVGRALFEWINLNKRAPDPLELPRPSEVRLGSVDAANPYTVPYSSIEEVLSAFQVPQQPRIGDIFRATRAHTHLTILRFWQSNITGFVGRDGLCFILYKVERPSDSRWDFPFDYNWLNKNLFQGDGKTLVDPPKNRIANESPEIRQPNNLK